MFQKKLHCFYSFLNYVLVIKWINFCVSLIYLFLKLAALKGPANTTLRSPGVMIWNASLSLHLFTRARYCPRFSLLHLIFMCFSSSLSSDIWLYFAIVLSFQPAVPRMGTVCIVICILFFDVCCYWALFLPFVSFLLRVFIFERCLGLLFMIDIIKHDNKWYSSLSHNRINSLPPRITSPPSATTRAAASNSSISKWWIAVMIFYLYFSSLLLRAWTIGLYVFILLSYLRHALVAICLSPSYPFHSISAFYMF